MGEWLDALLKLNTKPSLYEPGEPLFWDDPHISGSMLDAHLNPNHDAASRKPETIDKTVQHLFASGVLKPGMKVLDLGCGPGLYAERLCRAGAIVVGLDISGRSIEYARKHAWETKLNIEYHCMNFFDMDYTNEFDIVMQVYGELCTFSDEKRDILLWLDQYIVMEGHTCKVYRNWFHDYSLCSIRTVLQNAGFVTKHVWNDLTGTEYTEGGDWIAVAAEVRKHEDY